MQTQTIITHLQRLPEKKSHPRQNETYRRSRNNKEQFAKLLNKKEWPKIKAVLLQSPFPEFGGQKKPWGQSLDWAFTRYVCIPLNHLTQLWGRHNKNLKDN